jgi:hypothetical protein
VTFVLLSLDNDEARWRQTLTKYNLFADGIIHFRVGADSHVANQYNIKEPPKYVLLSRTGVLVADDARHPSDAMLEEDLKELMAE